MRITIVRCSLIVLCAILLASCAGEERGGTVRGEAFALCRGAVETYAGCEDSDAPRLVFRPSRDVEIHFRERSFLVVHERDIEGNPTPHGSAAILARRGGASRWTAASRHTASFEEWLDIERGFAFADRPLGDWEVVGHTLRAAPTGVHVLNAEGHVVAHVSAPAGWDRQGNPVPLRLTVERGRIVLYADANGAAVLVDPLWVPTGSMSFPRCALSVGDGAMVAAPDGALIAGGRDCDAGGSLASAERYSEATGVWTLVRSMAVPRLGHTLTQLTDGRTLAVGGASGPAELYDPVADAWSPVGSANVEHTEHSAARLADGRVLVVGGQLGAGSIVELYDPIAGAWSVTGSLNESRASHTATLLADGRVLVAGGRSNMGAVTRATAEVYDPATGVWSPTGSLNVARMRHTATLLPSGRVLVAGGLGSSGTLRSAEEYDPTTGSWTLVPATMVQPRSSHSATLLPSGNVLLAGSGATSEVYSPALRTFASGAPLVQSRSSHAAILLPSGRVLLAGGSSAPGAPHARTEILEETSNCGDGTIGPGEQCDDGNTADSDCCSSHCQFEPGVFCNTVGACHFARCTATSAVCPPPGPAEAGRLCRGATGTCDIVDYCDGVSTVCPNAMLPAGTVCRPATSACDVPETCSGTDGMCPTPLYAAAGTPCRPSAGPCDVAEVCTGGGELCPPDAFATAATPCRPAVGVCDASEACTGSGAQCPPDAARPAGAPCSAGSGACDAPDVCAGTVGATATCEERFAPAGTACRAASCAGGIATASAACTGDSLTCPTATSSCTPYVCGGDSCATSCSVDGDCAAGFFCGGAACLALLANGATCDRGAACTSGHCVDGVCCDRACTGQCEACDVAFGTCVPVVGAPHGLRAPCTGEGTTCGGECDGETAGGCAFPADETACGAASCTAGVETEARTCDGAGACEPPASNDCAPFTCGTEGCLTVCTDDLDCVSTFVCAGGACVDELPDAGVDAGDADDGGPPGEIDGGNETDAGGAMDAGIEGDAGTDAARVDASGAPDATIDAASDAGTSRLEGGCSCRAGMRRTSTEALVVIALISLFVTRRRLKSSRAR